MAKPLTGIAGVKGHAAVVEMDDQSVMEYATGFDHDTDIPVTVDDAPLSVEAMALKAKVAKLEKGIKDRLAYRPDERLLIERVYNRDAIALAGMLAEVYRAEAERVRQVLETTSKANGDDVIWTVKPSKRVVSGRLGRFLEFPSAIYSLRYSYPPDVETENDMIDAILNRKADAPSKVITRSHKQHSDAVVVTSVAEASKPEETVVSDNGNGTVEINLPN